MEISALQHAMYAGLGHAVCIVDRPAAHLSEHMHAGDWFNRLDFSYQSNNFGVGLPPAAKNEATWPIKRPLLADHALKPSADHIQVCLVRMRCLSGLESPKDVARESCLGNDTLFVIGNTEALVLSPTQTCSWLQ